VLIVDEVMTSHVCSAADRIARAVAVTVRCRWHWERTRRRQSATACSAHYPCCFCTLQARVRARSV